MTPDEIKELRELADRSTKVNSWYAHSQYENPEGATVRGPYNRWFVIKEVPEIYKKHVADSYDDAKFAAEAMNNLSKLLDTIDRLQKQNEIMKQALEFYSNEDSYFSEPTRCVDVDNNQVFATPEVLLDKGQLARKALKDCEKLK